MKINNVILQVRPIGPVYCIVCNSLAWSEVIPVNYKRFQEILQDNPTCRIVEVDSDNYVLACRNTQCIELLKLNPLAYTQKS